MKFRERPKVKLQNWEERIVAGTVGKLIGRELAIAKGEMIGSQRRWGW